MNRPSSSNEFSASAFDRIWLMGLMSREGIREFRVADYGGPEAIARLAILLGATKTGVSMLFASGRLTVTGAAEVDIWSLSSPAEFDRVLLRFATADLLRPDLVQIQLRSFGDLLAAIGPRARHQVRSITARP